MVMAILLFIFWLILNGRITVEVVVIGAVFSAVLSFASCRILHIDPRRMRLLFLRLPAVVMYLLYLIWQVILSALQVMRVILSPDDGKGPKMIWFRPKTKSGISRLVLSSSVTLTPGTVTASLGDNIICICALRPELAEGMQECGFIKKLCRMEGSKDG